MMQGQPMRPMGPPGARPPMMRPNMNSPMRPPMMSPQLAQQQQRPMMSPQQQTMRPIASPPQVRPLSPQQGNLVAPMQNMNIQQQQQPQMVSVDGFFLLFIVPLISQLIVSNRLFLNNRCVKQLLANPDVYMSVMIPMV